MTERVAGRRAAYTRAVDDPTPILPPAVIGILGGGQLGRMLALAARAMGYRIAVLDPDPDCPAASVADRVVVGSYDDVGAALRLADRSAVVTYELEHVAAGVVEALEARLPVRPGHRPLTVTQDRLAERRFVEGAGVAVAPWREVRSPDEARAAAAAELGLPLRLKLPIGGYDGRGQLRILDGSDLDDAWPRLGRTAGTPLLAERELDFEAELSIVLARDTQGRTAAFPVARNVHDAGILVETVAPAPVSPDVAERAIAIGERLAAAMDLCGTLTAELFLLGDGSTPRQRARPARPQQRPLDDRRRRDLAVRAARPGDLRPPARLAGRTGSGRHGQPAGHRPASTGATPRCRDRAGRPGGPPPPLRQASRLRASQDGTPHRARRERG